MDSILTSIKKLLGIAEDYTHFDDNIIIHINSAFSSLSQLGVGPSYGFHIEDDSETWIDFFGESSELYDVRTYIYLKVSLWFDPPTSSAVLSAKERQISELEWRLNVAAEQEPV